MDLMDRMDEVDNAIITSSGTRTGTFSVYVYLIFLLLTLSIAVSAAESPLTKGDECLEAGLYERAVQLYRQFLISPEAADPHAVALARLHMAHSYAAQEKYREALESLEQLFPKFPSDLCCEAYCLAAYCSQQLHNYPAAYSYLKQCVEDKKARLQLGVVCERMGRDEEAQQHFLSVADGPDSPFQKLARLHLAKAWISQGKQAEASTVLSGLIENSKEDPLTHTAADLLVQQEAFLLLHGFFAAQLALAHSGEEGQQYLALADCSFREAVALPLSNDAASALLFLALLYDAKGDPAAAEKIYLEVAEKFPESPQGGEAWFWAASCAEKRNDRKLAGERKRKVFENFPTSPYAAEAFFTLYTFQEYLQGERNASKHLQEFISNYEETPLLIVAHYLTGLDYKRDRKSFGKWVRKRNLTAAIDAFQQAETLFDSYVEKRNSFPSFDYYRTVRFRAALERAKCNLSIAEESQGAKRQIYLEYAEEVFEKLAADLKAVFLSSHHDYLETVFEEGIYWLAKTCLKLGKEQEANRMLAEMAEYYRQKKTSRGYYLSRILYEQGRQAMKSQQVSAALGLLQQAEEAGKGGLLSTDQKLELWIQESACYQGMGQFEEAILILSKVVNADEVSSLRLQAMYLRAALYEQQGRPEFARKQLESLAKKGGIWAMKAKQKLEGQ
jgi:tetratricopeptide (TPR) repeat protein